ncbi:MAG: a-glycosyltransferase [Bacteroidetes bacterium]|nr:MAG: a-glycosyltransferase [Bacteroidota bacterium]
MGERKCIGIIYYYNEGWIGGTYYIENIIAALNSLDDKEKPFLKIFTSTKDEYDGLIEKLAYPYAQYISSNVNYNLIERITNKIGRALLKKNIFVKKAEDDSFDFIFPNPGHSFFSSISETKKVYWIPDFQEDYLPQFFSEEELMIRKNSQKKLANNAKYVIFSSRDACEDFKRLYPDSNVQKIVLPFAVRPGINLDEKKSNEIVLKYKITKPFLLIPNQLWIHKNHKTVIYAAKILADQRNPIQFIFSGKNSDFRFPDYPQELYNLVESLNLSGSVKFLGFIPKDDLSALMQHSLAIIQPSLFEGWSTVVEEAKCMNKFIFASNIPIHLEQLEKYPNKTHFEKESSEALVKAIYQFWTDPPCIEKYDYETDFINFGKAIIKLI